MEMVILILDHVNDLRIAHLFLGESFNTISWAICGRTHVKQFVYW